DTFRSDVTRSVFSGPNVVSVIGRCVTELVSGRGYSPPTTQAGGVFAGQIEILLLLLGALSCVSVDSPVTNAQDVRSSCQAHSVATGADTSITCKFSQNINETKRLFNIQKRELHSSGTDSETVLHCLWPVQNPNVTKCFIKEGYTYNGLVSDTLQLEIPDATKEHEGLYKCQATPFKPADVQSCELTLKELTTEGSSTEKPQSTTVHTTEISSSETAGIVVGVLLTIAVIGIGLKVFVRNP
ncbi:hypothetical protein BaRGS_00024557, partial [Batillaria attramentaria]